MNIRVTVDDRTVLSRHYEEFAPQRNEAKESGDLAKLLAVKRNMTVKPKELELMKVCKDNQLTRKTVQQIREICESIQDP